MYTSDAFAAMVDPAFSGSLIVALGTAPWLPRLLTWGAGKIIKVLP